MARTLEAVGLQRRAWPHGAATAPSLRAGALLLAASVALPAALMGIGVWSAWHAAWRDAASELQASADAVAEYGQRALSGQALALGRIDAALYGLSDDALTARASELAPEVARLIRDTPGTEAAFVLDARGVPVLAMPAGVALPATTAGVSTAAGLVIGAVVPRAGQPLAFRIAMPRGTAEDGGTIALAVRPDAIAERLRRALAHPQDGAGLVRTDGEVLARSGGLAAPMSVPAIVAPIGQQAERALFEARSPHDGTRQLVAVRRIEGWPVHAVTARPRLAILEEWRTMVAGQLAIGLPATAALMILAFAVLRGQGRLLDTNAELEARVAARTVDLAEKEALLRGALEAGRVFAFELDLDAGTVMRSPNAAGILGLPPQAAVRDTVRDVMAAVLPEDRPKLREVVARATPDAPAWSVRYRFRRPDGRTVWLHDQGVARFGPDGRVTRLTSLSRDVTAEVEAEQAKLEAALRLRAAAEGAGIGAFEIDLARRAAWFDARGTAILGGLIPTESWVPLAAPEWRAVEASIHPDDRIAYAAAWTGLLTGRLDDRSVETRLRRPDGSVIWVWCHGIARDRDPATGRPARVVGVLHDITERRRLQAQLRHGQKLQALGEIAGGIAHDVNNVLQAISGSIAMADRVAGDAEAVRRRLRTMAEAVARGGAITSRLLAYSRRGELRAEPIEPRALLTGVAEMLRPALGPTVDLRIEADPGLPPLLADREQLQTALINLATNARDAMPRGGTLRIAAMPVCVAGGVVAGLAPGDYMRLDVRDSGTGMDAAILAHVGEPFFTTKPPGKGTGLGLSLVKSFVEGSQGGFAIESAPGRGTTVSLWLPLGTALPVAPASTAPVARGTGAGTLLVVDDDALVRETLAEELEAEGYEVLAADGAAQALTMLETNEGVRALVTDLTMPGLDGVALILEARRRVPGLPAVLVTGRAEEAELPQDSGPSAVLHKPIGGAAVAARVAALLAA
jgi:PAS domain S-box-containing protein